MELAEFCKFYPGMTPKAYWDLTVSEYEVLRAYMREWAKEQKRAAESAKARRRR